MIIVILAGLGLCFGSFVNALVWRVYQQETSEQKTNKELSILRGRSMCPGCKHELAAKDLIPILSWLSLRGKCRYCNQKISIQYPLVELLTALLFVASYEWWPISVHGSQITVFGLWLALLVGLLALLVYDLRWLILPDRIMYPLMVIALAQAAIGVAASDHPLAAVANIVLAVIVGGGIFYSLFQISKGRWIGGGDVKLGWLLGLIVATPGRSLLVIFVASLLGSLISLPLLAMQRLQRNSTIPFGPFLIIGAVVTVLFGATLLGWYQTTFMGLGT